MMAMAILMFYFPCYQMDLHLDIHNLFRANKMEEFAHLSNMPGSIFVTPSPKNKIYNSSIEGNQLYMFKPKHLELFDRVRSEFVTRADHLIMQQQHINSLTIDFLLGSQHQHIIDEWISSAISKGAQHIHLSFSHHDYGMPNIQPYIFPTNTLFSDDHQNTKPLKHLHLTNCLLLPCPNFSGFKHLKTLVLQELIVGNDMLLCLLTNSYLENLTFIQCHFIRTPHTTYTISSTMHHLKIITSLFLKSVISISAPNLSSFEYRDKILSISSIDAPQLSNCSLTPLDLDTPSQEHLEIPHAFALLASLPKLRTLSLCLSPKQVGHYTSCQVSNSYLFLLQFFHSIHQQLLFSLQVARFPPTICHLQHLTQMDLFFIGPQDENDDYFLILKIVMACPRLQKLAFGVSPLPLSSS
jgi:hypothetical protein